MKKFKNTLLLLIPIFLILPSISSCKVRPKEFGSIYRTAMESDVPSLDPLNVGDTASHDVAYNIYNGLVAYRASIKNKGESLTDIVPDLAEKWTVSKDEKTFTFYIRKGVKFHNGRELTADDIKYNIERIANPKNASKGLWTLRALPIKGIEKFQQDAKDGKKDLNLEGVKIKDSYKVEITLEKSIPFALHVLAMSYYLIAPKEEIEKWGKDFTFHPIGTGPFKFKEWNKGKEIILEKNTEYFEKGLPHLDKLVYEIIPSNIIRFGRFENGQLEHIDNASIPSSRFESLINDPRWNPLGTDKIREIETIQDTSETLILKKPNLSSEYLGMDTKSELFSDKNVRKAINYAIDKQKIVDRVYNGRRVISTGILPKGFPGFDEKREVPYPYDPDKALELLNKAGWKDSNNDGILDKDGKKFTVSLWFNQREELSALCSSVQADLSDIGIDIETRALQWSPYVEKIRKNEAIFYRYAWMADYPDPDNFLWTLFSSDNLGGDNNTRYSNPQVDKLLNQARSITDWNKRVDLYRKAEEIIIDDAPWVFVDNEVSYKVVQSYVKGQQLHPIIQNIMKIVKIEK